MMEQLNYIADEHTCNGIAIMRDGKMLVGLRNYTSEKRKNISVRTTPGWMCEAGETIEQWLRREVEEETWITDLTITHFLGIVQPAGPGKDVYFFLWTSEQEPQNKEPHKFSERKWEYPEKIENYINPAQISLILDYLSEKK